MTYISLVACGLCAFVFLAASYMAWEPDDYDDNRRPSLAATIAPAIPGIIFAAGFVNLLVQIIRA